MRHPRLRAEEALGDREPLRRRLSGRGRIRLERRRTDLRLADPRQGQGQGDQPALRRLSPEFGAIRRKARRTAGDRARPSSGALRRRARGHRSPHLVASGSRPVAPTGIAGIEHAISSNEVFDLPVFPRRLLVVGGGYIAVEFASLFQRLGSRVTMVMRGANLLRGFDEDMREGMRDAMVKAGIVFRFGCLPTSIEKNSDGSLARDAFRRHRHRSRSGPDRNRPQPQHQGPRPRSGRSRTDRQARRGEGQRQYDQQRGVDPRDRRRHPPGRPDAGRHSRRAYAGRPPVRTGRAPLRYDTIGSTVFGTPELGAVGLTESEALQKFKKVHIYKTNFRPLKATVSGSPERTLMKLVTEGSTERIVGAHILGGEAAEMIQLVAVAMTMGATKADFDATIAVHPTAAEELVTMRSAHARYEDGMQIA